MAEIRINATGGVKLYDADDSHYAQIVAGTITSNVDAITLGHDTVTIADNLSLGSDSAVLKFGADGDTTLTHTDGTGLTLNSTNKLCFQDTGTYVHSNADGDLDIVSDGTAVDSINLESAGGITLDAGTAGSGIIYEDDGTEMLRIYNSSSDVVIQPKVNGKDIHFKQYDGNLLLDINDGGWVGLHNAAAGPGELRIYEDTDLGSHYTGFKAGNATASVSYVLPLADGSNGNALLTNGSGTLSWGSGGTTYDGIDDQTSSNDDQLTIKDGEVVINEDSDDLDFRVESNANSHMFCVDGGGDRVIIGTYGDTGEGGLGELNIKAAHSTTYATVPGELTHAEAGNGTLIEMFNSNTTDNNYSNITFIDGGGFMNGAILCRNVDHDTNGGGSLHFFTRLTSSGSDACTERIHLSHQGVIETFGETGTRYTFRQKAEGDTGTHYYNSFVKADGSVIGSITSNSSNAAFNTSSDYRLKENQTAITDGITRIKQLKPYRFNWKTKPDETVDGFFAHEVTTAVPEAVQGEKDAMEKVYYTKHDAETQGDNATKKVGDFKEYHSTEIVPQQIDQSKLVPLLVAAVKELTAKVEALEG